MRKSQSNILEHFNFPSIPGFMVVISGGGPFPDVAGKSQFQSNLGRREIHQKDYDNPDMQGNRHADHLDQLVNPRIKEKIPDRTFKPWNMQNVHERNVIDPMDQPILNPPDPDRIR